MTETELQSAILAALGRLGVWAWRVNAGARGGVRMAPAGTPDICIVDPAGWLEVKLPGQDLRPLQRIWHRRAGERGVRVAVVTSVEEAVSIVRDWRDHT